MTSFTDVTKQVHLINDLILSDMKYEPDSTVENTSNFAKRLVTTKLWFSRISYINKKRYLFVLLQDVRSAWTLSLLLKSLWNCRPKDAIMSMNERGGCLSGYDQVPMDHNRTTYPVNTLAMAMKNDRIWFVALEPENQALVLSELLQIAGGPVMWEVLRRARTLYDQYRDQLYKNLRDSISVHDDKSQQTSDKAPTTTTAVTPETGATSVEPPPAPSTPGQKNYEAQLLAWNATIKALKDSLKLEEIEMNFLDGNKRKIWKVNRPKIDIMETVDFLQLLPSAVGKKILSYLPVAQLAEYARVNRYWTYLVEEYRNEVAARNKLVAEYDKLEQHVIKHDESMYQFIAHKDLAKPRMSSTGMQTTGQQSTYKKQFQASMKPSEKSAGVYSLRHLSDTLHKPKMAQKPVANMAELNERMERRGATDENIWKWCENVIALTVDQKRYEQKGAKKTYKKTKTIKKLLKTDEPEGVLRLDVMHFPCPLMKYKLVVPLESPLYRDPAELKSRGKPKRLVSDTTLQAPKAAVRRYSLWTRDVSSLYPVYKIPSYQFPFHSV